MLCLRCDIEHDELHVSSKESLRLQLGAEGVHSLLFFCFVLFLASQIQKAYSIEDLINFLIVFSIRLLLKPSFLKQHKTGLERYSLAPTSTAKVSHTSHQILCLFLKFSTC